VSFFYSIIEGALKDEGFSEYAPKSRIDPHLSKMEEGLCKGCHRAKKVAQWHTLFNQR
jgi:hypothetical protein